MTKILLSMLAGIYLAGIAIVIIVDRNESRRLGGLIRREI
jgi:hypothetical protein